MALTKVDDRGLKTPIDLLDDEKIRLGTGNDLELFHQGGYSIIKDKNDNPINIQTDGEIKLAKDGNAETYARFIPDGAVELYHNNLKKLETTSTGVSVTGGLTTTGTINFNSTSDNVNFTGASYNALWNPSSNYFRFNDNAKAVFGTSGDLSIYHDASNNFIKSTNGHISLIASQVNINNGDDSENCATFVGDGAVNLFHNGTKKFETTSDGATITGNIKPDADSTRYLGSNGVRFAKVFADNYEGSAANLTDIFVTGMIMLWSGASNAIPTGWVICDGSNSTPDLRDRFVVGAGSTYSVGDTGGHAHINLTVSQLPAHTHDLLYGSGSFGGSSGAVVPRDTGTITDRIGSTGSGSSVENRPPYYALCYIMKT